MDNEEFLPIMRITDSLRELNQSFLQVTHKEAEGCGSTRTQFLVLRTLHLHPMIRLNELADLMHASASTASAVVDRLAQAGLIVRERPETDRRSVLLKLSPEGFEQMQKTGERIMERLSPLLELSDEEVNELVRIQGKIINILQKVREES